MGLDYIAILDLLGVVAFAISGALTAMKKRMDPFGILIVAFVTAIGGGTLRDLLIGLPVAWLHNRTYIYVIIGTAVLAVLLRKQLSYIHNTLTFFDTVGLSIFTLIGLERALGAGFSPEVCIAMGTMTGCFGGILRDILANKIPIIFHKEIYATACILGGLLYFLLDFLGVPSSIVFIAGALTVFIVRSLAVFFNLQLPTVYLSDKK